ncbi:hypothetical protein L917_03269, partial [Phytophthora nicotianae]
YRFNISFSGSGKPRLAVKNVSFARKLSKKS